MSSERNLGQQIKPAKDGEKRDSTWSKYKQTKSLRSTWNERWKDGNSFKKG